VSAQPRPTVEAYVPSAPAAERRLVSILFADLVGFTTLSEGRDAEEVRELLGRYFQTAQRLVARYGGTIEKFIGDAVMAVWGAPVAQEDDAERAVRAAIDLVDAVAEVGKENGLPDLRARAGVLTGEAAVTLGAEGQGMVAGDLVNTASRIQSAAAPGSVLVGEGTRRATEAAIVYEDAGRHELKGKAESVPLWRASRVVAGRRGAQKSTGLEPPFVGRDRELRLVKQLFHSSAEERRAHLVSVIGVAGIGKSRLAWEFEKYVDGLLDSYLWHRGRCLAYGEGVTYWALAEMVRMRARIVEGEDQTSATAKLHEVIAQYVHDPEEREWVEPRLAHLLGLEERTARDPEDLFSAWRVLFERMAEDSPVVLVFEDMQWADRSLVDFVDYLMNWSKNHPLFVVLLARPEFVDKHPNHGAGRGSTTLYLEPLTADAMDALLSGLVPGLPSALRAKIQERAEGVPLYAVETVRMLLDRGLLVQEGSAYRPTGPVEDLEVPETLQALIAARLDALEPNERRLIQDAAVVGKTFTPASLIALSGMPRGDIEQHLGSLLRKEFLTIQADPRSPEHGQYSFLQDLVRRVAYETLARKDRKARHLAAATFLETEWGPEEDEIVEVVASHYVEAYNAAPDAPDAARIKSKACLALIHAGRRAESLAASEEAVRYFSQAIELTDDPASRAELHERAGHMARIAGKTDFAVEHYEASIALFQRAEMTHPAARVTSAYGEALRDLGKIDEAMEQMGVAYEVLSTEKPDADFATLLWRLARMTYFRGDIEEAARYTEQSLALAENLQLPEVFAHALNTKGLTLMAGNRSEEALVLLRHALQVSLENDLMEAAMRSFNNIGAMMNERDRHDEELTYGEQQIELANKIGSRQGEARAYTGQIGPLCYLGRWDEALAIRGRVQEADIDLDMLRTTHLELMWEPIVFALRGEVDEARRSIEGFAVMEHSTDIQELSTYWGAVGYVLLAEGKHTDALVAGEEALRYGRELGIRSPGAKEAFIVCLEAAFAIDDLAKVDALLDELGSLPPGQITPLIGAQLNRNRARLAVVRGERDGVETGFRTAIEQFREMKMPYWLGVTSLELGEWLRSQGREAEAAGPIEEARDTFTALRARPMLERVERATEAAAKATG